MHGKDYIKLLQKYHTLLQAHIKLSSEYNEIMTNYAALGQRYTTLFNKHLASTLVVKPHLHGDED